MQNETLIKQVELHEKDALFDFLRDVYADNPRQSDPDFWHWRYISNPLCAADGIPVWVAKQGERIVAQTGATPAEVMIDGKKEHAIWIQDMMTHEVARRQGLGKRVVSAGSDCPVMLGINTMEQHAPAMLQSLGWVIVGKINRYSKLVFPGNAVRELSSFKPLGAMVNAGFSVFRSTFAKNSGIKKVERFDSSFDKLWHDAYTQWNCAVIRDAKMLNWQYVDQPGKKFEILGFYKEQELKGYIVLFFRKKNKHGVIAKGAITDICYHPDEPAGIVDELLKAALNLAIEHRVGSLVTDVVDPLVEERLQEFGFWRVKNPLQLMVKSEKYRERAYDINNWFITRGDSDVSIFEDPNL